ncbi:MAG TPA: hypothetical protein VGX70_11240 [Gemmataceae bacterium]|nr:hypothetical protein [Gemmataceae bacterium]
MTKLILFLSACISLIDAQKENPVEIYADSTKTYSPNEEFSLPKLKSLYARVAEKTQQRKNLSDRNKADVLVCVDAKNHIHFRPFLTDEWTQIDDSRTLPTKLEENYFRDSTCMDVFLILDPKSDPEATGKVVQLILEKKYAKLTLMFGNRVIPESDKSKRK